MGWHASYIFHDTNPLTGARKWLPEARQSGNFVFCVHQPADRWFLPVLGLEAGLPDHRMIASGALGLVLWVPFLRTMGLWAGMCRDSPHTYAFLLQDSGQAIVVAPQDELKTKPAVLRCDHEADLAQEVMRQVLIHGAVLVPSCVFAEPDFDPAPPQASQGGHFFRAFSWYEIATRCKQVHEYVARQCPAKAQVYGVPLRVRKTENPTPEQVETVFSHYMHAIESLQDQYGYVLANEAEVREAPAEEELLPGPSV
eukprot:gene4082-4421_t